MDPTFEHLSTGSDEESRAGPDAGYWRLNPSVFFFKGPSIMAIGSRCICLSIECPAEKVHFLEAAAAGNESKCL